MESEKVKDIKEALENCANPYGTDCYHCPYLEKGCNIKLMEDILTLINELEKEKKENTSYAKGYADGIKNTYEVVVPDKLKQFAEMLKEKMGVREYMGIKYKQGVFSENDIDETLKEFIND